MKIPLSKKFDRFYNAHTKSSAPKKKPEVEYKPLEISLPTAKELTAKFTG